MITELLILKHNAGYIRVKDELYMNCGMDKASAFPVTELKTVENHRLELTHQGFVNAAIYRLIIREEPLS